MRARHRGEAEWSERARPRCPRGRRSKHPRPTADRARRQHPSCLLLSAEDLVKRGLHVALDRCATLLVLTLLPLGVRDESLAYRGAHRSLELREQLLHAGLTLG